jgi:hypothetical protein
MTLTLQSQNSAMSFTLQVKTWPCHRP